MIPKKGDSLLELKKVTSRERKTITELASLVTGLDKIKDDEEKMAVLSQVKFLRELLKKDCGNVLETIKNISMNKPIQKQELANQEIPEIKKRVSFSEVKKIEETLDKGESLMLEKGILKRLKKKEDKSKKKKERTVNPYVKLASKYFAGYSRELIKKGKFETVRFDLTKASLRIAPTGYVSVIFLTTITAGIIGFLAFIFLLFFNLSALPPFISLASGNFGLRALKFALIPILLPIVVFAGLYFYPGLEKRANEDFINRELPFATIHMSSIAGSLIEPTKIFSIIISTNEYPYLEKEFKKLINEINIYGYDLVTALRNAAFRSPSKKLADLYNGLSTTINSGGDLATFFDKRSESLLLEHRLEREKYTKTTETFMDIYISVVVAAPMILMLLLMMMQISGLGVSLSPTALSLIMVLGVTVINIFFLTFLHLKQPSE